MFWVCLYLYYCYHDMLLLSKNDYIEDLSGFDDGVTYDNNDNGVRLSTSNSSSVLSRAASGKPRSRSSSAAIMSSPLI
jgi:hypothetical protein